MEHVGDFIGIILTSIVGPTSIYRVTIVGVCVMCGVFWVW